MLNMNFLILIILLLLISIIVLQVFLSKRKNKWFGLIPPIINFLFSLISIFGLAFYLKKPITETLMAITIPFFLFNIPTIILIAIYFACREKFKKKKDLDKMNIQDLE